MAHRKPARTVLPADIDALKQFSAGVAKATSNWQLAVSSAISSPADYNAQVQSLLALLIDRGWTTEKNSPEEVFSLVGSGAALLMAADGERSVKLVRTLLTNKPLASELIDETNRSQLLAILSRRPLALSREDLYWLMESICQPYLLSTITLEGESTSETHLLSPIEDLIVEELWPLVAKDDFSNFRRRDQKSGA